VRLFARDRLTVVYAGLVLATVASLWLGTDRRVPSHDGRTIGACIVMAVAFVKVRFIGLDFMDLRSAPLVLRAAFELWCLLVGAAIVALLVLGR
jgi:hypothetical protein